MATVARRAVVSGRVQGVGFRYSCRHEAQQLGVRGWVRNLPDGRVEAHVEGEEAQVAAILDWLHRGPSFARVSSVEVSDTEPTGATGFGAA
jgi:acylphosphatase